MDESARDSVPQRTAALGLEEFSRQPILRTDLRVERIRQESDNSTSELSRSVQGQLQQTREQMVRLGKQVQACTAHTERLRLQVVALGHTADSRHTEATCHISELSPMMERKLVRKSESPSSQPPHAGGARETPSQQAEGGSDPTILLASVRVAVTRQQT